MHIFIFVPNNYHLFFRHTFQNVPFYWISGMDNSSALKKLEDMILECSRLDREINCFVESVDEMTAQVCLADYFHKVFVKSPIEPPLLSLICSAGQTRTSGGHGSSERLCKGPFHRVNVWSFRRRPAKAQQGCCLQRQCQEICHSRWDTTLPAAQHSQNVS